MSHNPFALSRILDFEGHKLEAIASDAAGEEYFHPSQVEAALGMQAGKLSSRIAEYAKGGDLAEGVDFVVLRGPVLDALKSATEDSPLCGVPSLKYSNSLTLLKKSGVRMVGIKSRTSAGRRFRKWIIHELLPAHDRGETLTQPEPKDERLRAREERLSRQLEERQIRRQAKARREAAKIGRRLGADERVCAVIELEAAALEAGRDFAGLLPDAEPDWLSPTEIGDLLGVTANKVGRTISSLGLREVADGLARSVMNTGNKGKRTVITWQYSPRAVEQIRAALSASA